MKGTYKGLSKIVKVILQLFFGALISPIYRIYNGKVIIGLLLIFIPVGMLVFWWIDLFTIITTNEISVLA